MSRLHESIGRFRLACYIPRPSDITSFARGLGPLSAMVREEPRFEVVLPRMVSEGIWDLSWDWMAGCDAVFLQRPGLPAHLDCAIRAKMMNLPVWIDWDDDLRTLSRANPEFAVYSKQENFEAVDRLTAIADALSFSTPFLKDQRCRSAATPAQGSGAIGGKSVVIPNACQFPFSPFPRRKTIAWRGSKHHAENIATVLPQIEAIAASPRWRDWHWHFFGEVPWQVFDAVPRERLTTSPTVNLFAYMDALARAAPSVQIVPLRDTPFNRSKSNLAWLDATASGAVTLAPDWEEWRRPGIVNYTTPDGFGARLEETLSSFPSLGTAMHPNVGLSRKYVRDHLTLRNLNAARWKILDGLLMASLSR